MAKEIKVGDVFGVPLNDGTYGLVKILLFEKRAMNSYLCSLFDRRINSFENSLPTDANPISICFVTPESFLGRKWVKLDSGFPTDEIANVDIEGMRRSGFVGAKIFGSAIVRKFLNAYYGLEPWDGYADPKYFEKFLLPGVTVPDNIIFAD